MRFTMLTTRRVGLSIAATMFAVALAVPALVSAQAATTTWRAALTGANEVPAVTTTATGTFTGTLDEAAGTLAWTLTVPAATSITAAHLHAGVAGANGGVVLGLYTPAAGTAGVASLNLTGTARVADLSGSLAGNFAGFVTALKAGGLYANVHTTANPGGEIRAQVTSATQATATPAPTAAAPAATAAAAATPSAAPTAPKTGTAGLADGGSSVGVLAVMAALTLAVVVGGRALVGRRSPR